LEQARAYLREHDIEAEYANLVGPPADTIIRLAKVRGADLIVVGSRGSDAIKRMLGQSVSASVTREAPCAVLVVRESERAVPAARSGAHRPAQALETPERIAADQHNGSTRKLLDAKARGGSPWLPAVGRCAPRRKPASRF
jgi:hypothetical protein